MVPLVDDVAVVFEIDVVVGLRRLVAHTELGDESRVVGALVVEDLFGRVPVHDRLQHGAQEAAVAVGLVLRARRHRVRDITKDAVVADQRREVGRPQVVHHLNPHTPLILVHHQLDRCSDGMMASIQQLTRERLNVDATRCNITIIRREMIIETNED